MARPRRRLLGGVTVMALLAGGLLVVGAAPAGASTRTFASVYSVNTTGNIMIRGNTLMTCPPGSTGITFPPVGNADLPCATAQGAGSWGRDNDFNMIVVDTDGNSSTFDSSSATVTIPTGATVLRAYLMWSAETSPGTNGTALTNSSLENTASFKTPGNSYVSETSPVVDSVSDGSAAPYQSVANVTSAVQAAGSGVYWVGNVQASTGQDRYAGWSLAIAYDDPTQPVRNLNIYTGFGDIDSGGNGGLGSNNLAIPISGFTTPSTGTVATEVGLVAWEGDRGNVGDGMTVGSTAMTNAINPANDIFNSTISDLGTSITSGNPSYQNTLGTDIDTFDATGALANSSTSTIVHMTTSGETYFPGMLTFATTLNSPALTATKTVTDVTASTVASGDLLDYSVGVTNTGTDTSSQSVLTDAVPANTTYVAGSLSIGGTPVTDATGDDAGDVTGGIVTARLGTGATASAGGQLAIGATTTVTFGVHVNAEVSNGVLLTNTAALTYSDVTTGASFSGFSSTVTSTVNAPALAFSSPPSGEATVAYTDTLTGSGGTTPYAWSASSGTLPPGLSLGSSTGVLSGTPIAAGTFPFTVTITDVGGRTANEATSITIAAGPALSFTPPGGEVGVSYTDTIAATGGTGPYTYSKTAGSFPDGVSQVGSTGVLSGTPTAGGTSSFTMKVTDAAGGTASEATSITVVGVPALVVTPPGGEVGVAYTTTLAATGGTGPYTYAKTVGSFPAGVTLSSAGVLSGTPSAAGTSTFTVTATDANSQTAIGAASITIVARVALSTTPPGGEVGVTYAGTFVATGGTGPFTYATTPGSVPTGLTLSSAGVLSGTPTTAGTSTFTVTVTDGSGATAADSTSVNIIAGPSLTFTAPPTEVIHSFFTDTLTASGGTGPYTWSTTLGNLPTGVSFGFGTGVLSGTPSVAGTFPFTVVVTDADGQTDTEAVTLVVDPTSGLTTSAASVNYGTSVTLTDSLVPAAATGVVTFTDLVSTGPQAGQTVTLGTGTLSGGSAPRSFTLPAFGSNTITASYGGDSTYPAVVSSPLVEQVNAVSGEVIIDQFRLSGPSGANDQYVQLYNAGAAVSLAGFTLTASSGATITVPNTAPVLPKGHSYLITGGSYSLASTAAADASSANLGANGLQVTAPDQSATTVDAVGSTAAAAGYFSGTALPALSGTPTNQYAWVRIEKAGAPVNTSNNLADFKLVSTSGGAVGGVQSTLGSPSPLASGSPVQSNSTVQSTLLDPTKAASAAPNFVYTKGSPGTLTVRRTLTNTTGALVTTAELRFTSLSEANGLPEPGVTTQPPHIALLRLIDPATATSTVVVGGVSVTVENLSVDAPASSSPGGGLDTTLTVSLPSGLAVGATVSIAVTFAVDQGGTYWFGYDVDALTGAGPAAALPHDRSLEASARSSRGRGVRFAPGAASGRGILG